MVLDELLLLNGNDIPFEAGHLIIHQPTLQEIAFINEEPFFLGGQLLVFGKKFLDDSDKKDLEKFTNFDILMMVMNEQNPAVRVIKTYAKMVLALIFPNQSFSFEKDKIIFHSNNEGEPVGYLNNANFEEFRGIVLEVFCFKKMLGEAADDYNPGGPLARQIAEKFRERHKKLAQLKQQQGGGADKVSILARQQSILSIGLQLPLTDFKDYTVFQLFDQWDRQLLKLEYDMYIQAKLSMAGSSEMKTPEDWMKDLQDGEK